MPWVGKKKLVITKKQLLKMFRKANRELIRSIPPKIHKTHKKDKQSTKSNTIKNWED